MSTSVVTRPRFAWWISAPALVLVLMFWCQLHGRALGVEAVSLAESAPWALKAAFGWILAGGLLVRYGAGVLATRSGRKHPWTMRVLLALGVAAITLTSETLLLADDRRLSLWLYERAPVHGTFATLLLGVYLLTRARPEGDPGVRTDTGTSSNTLAPAAPAGIAPAAMLEVMTGTGRTRIRIGDIECLEADRNYINVHTRERSYLLRRSLASLEATLLADDFLRVHRSIIVNRAKIRERRCGGMLVLDSGRTVRVSRAHAGRLESATRL